MHTEYLDVVDDQDHVITQRIRSEIHAEGLCHRAVHILVFNEHGDLFLQKRSMKKDLNRGLWDTSAAGHVDAGESYAESAPRELLEELGVAAELIPLFKLSPVPELGMEFVQVYRCQHNGPFVYAPDEIDGGIWLSVSDVTHRVRLDDPSMTQTFKLIWQQFLLMLFEGA